MRRKFRRSCETLRRVSSALDSRASDGVAYDSRPMALKDFFSPALVERLAGEVSRAHPPFPRRAFVRDACSGLDGLELLARGRHIAGALARHLPAEYPEALDVLLRSLGPAEEGHENLGKGMASQAVQNLNCMFGFPETDGIADFGHRP